MPIFVKAKLKFAEKKTANPKVTWSWRVESFTSLGGWRVAHLNLAEDLHWFLGSLLKSGGFQACIGGQQSGEGTTQE